LSEAFNDGVIGAIGAAFMLGVQWASKFFKPSSGNGGNGNGHVKAIADAVAIAEIKKDLANLGALKEIVEDNSRQMFEFAKDHAEFTQAYIEKHAQLSERIARLESER